MEEEKVLLDATVNLLVRDDEVLLAIKTRKIGAGCWNGYGGGIEKGESPKQSAIRELEDETGKKIGDKFITTSPEYLEKVAIVFFHNVKSDGESFICRVHFFIIRKWEGEAVDTDEMINRTFFKINNLPFDQMMPADREFFPMILNGKKIIAKAMYGPYQKELLEDVEIQEVSSFPED